MMLVKRRRYVVMRAERTEVWCGLARHFYWKPVTDIGDTVVKTYRSEKQARAAYGNWRRNPDDVDYVPVTESIEVSK